MNKVERARPKRLALRVARTSFAEGVCDAGDGDGPALERRRKASRLALEALLSALAESEAPGKRPHPGEGCGPARGDVSSTQMSVSVHTPPSDHEREVLLTELDARKRYTGDAALANLLGRTASALRRAAQSEPTESHPDAVYSPEVFERMCALLAEASGSPTHALRLAISRQLVQCETSDAHREAVAYADDIAEGGTPVPDDYERHYCEEDGEDWPCSAVRATESVSDQVRVDAATRAWSLAYHRHASPQEAMRAALHAAATEGGER